MKKLRKWYDGERKKLRALSPGQIFLYIWEYYWLWIAAVLVSAVLLASLAVRLVKGAPEYALYVVFANTRADAGNGSALWLDYTQSLGGEPEGMEILFDAASYFDYTQNQARGNVYYDAFVTLSDIGVLDAVTMEPAQLAALGQSGRLLDWGNPRCGALREKYEDRLLYYTPPPEAEQMDPVPVGIDISDSLLVTRYGLYPENCALGIGAQSAHLDAVESFLCFLLEEQQT